MKIDVTAVRKCLKSFDFSTLFREHLGWDKHQAQLDVPVDGGVVRLSAVAQKRGFAAYVCSSIPDRATRLKIDHQLTKTAREHFVIYADQTAGQQVWQWVRREPGKPLASRDHRFDASQSGDPLIQRLEEIAVSLDEEDTFTLVQATAKVRKAFDVEKVTKKFYERFKAEHAAFLKMIKGIKSEADLQWYTSLMLNRLMFVYFIQKKGFLDSDTDYLRNRLKKVSELKGKDKFHSFYRYFLLRLFHDGLGTAEKERKLDRELEKLLGKVPYLNGGFFEVHQLEERNTEIDIPDKAFEKLFNFFDEFRWHLDERPLRQDNEINPDVVGYIFEKYINQKQMGAYYTKEDITEYISKNTIVPFLFDAAQKKCPIAFKPESFLWRLLRDDPDRYIYAAVRQGVVDSQGNVTPLPKEIDSGIKDVSKREGWNRAAAEPFALPTETWREHVARRQRCLSLREKLRRGEVHTINDLITLNLDIWQFARDAIVNSEGPELVRAFWQAIAGRVPEKSNEKFEPGITVLDPTCGSGAFLFAALRILETLYSDCLQGMASFLDEPDAAPTTDEQLQAIIARGENDRCEFKATMRHCIKTAQAAMPEDKRKEILKAKDKERNHDVLKSVAAMLNTAGGDVIVGVQDEGIPFGLEADYAYFSKDSERNTDGYELWLRQLFVNHFGVLNSQKVRAQFVTLEGKQVLWLRVFPAESAAYVLSDTKQKIFYIRNGNETRALEIEQVVAYHQSRFTPEAIKALPGPVPVPVARSAKKKRFEDFRAVLDQIRKHPNERYFILKSIIINNLFGVDIMEEAVEICKLRLFLKLAAQVERFEQIEPLPDIDFNIRAGNTLVGYVSLDQVRKSQAGTLGFGAKEVERIEEDALAVEKAFGQFRAQQTTHGGRVTTKDKQELRRRLSKLDAELDRYLAGEYGIDPAGKKPELFDQWKVSHQPFHWFVEFYGIMHRGGFDVIIGNPPYVVYSANSATYELRPNSFHTYPTKNLYAFVFERSIALVRPSSPVGLIVQLTAISSERMSILQDILKKRGSLFTVPFPRRPESVFEGVEMPVVVLISITEGSPRFVSTRINRFYSEQRSTVMQLLALAEHDVRLHGHRIAKVGNAIDESIFRKLQTKPLTVESLTSKSGDGLLYYQEACRYWLKAIDGLPFFSRNGKQMEPPHGRVVRFKSKNAASFVACLLNSSLFYWYYSLFSDCEHVNDVLLRTFPIPENILDDDWLRLASRLRKRLAESSNRKTIKTKQGHTIQYDEMKAAAAKDVIDEIDQILGKRLGLDASEIDALVNYDIKYRMAGLDDDE